MIGRKLSHYEIINEISRGGMGVVYRAVDVNLGRDVALKVLPEELVHDPARRERLLQEARAASALEHPHIAVIHEVGDADGVTFIAMELIRGEKLSETLGRGPLLQGRALTLATEIAEGLARAHEKGIIHRDLKPANVMVTDDGHVKIIDFGLAKLIEPVSHDAATATVQTPQTAPGLVLGTAAYMSPEQARGGRVDHRSDIFALGVTLYEMITGRAAFQGRSSLETMHAILTQPVPPLPAMAGASAEATADLQRIIAKCTTKDADDRFQGMKDLIVDLRAARRRLESGQTSAVVTPVSGPQVVPVMTGGTSKRILTAVVLALVVVVSGFLWWIGQRDQPTAVSPSGKPALAVLYFENNTGDASLDWMRTGLTDMMVTDLSQSTDFEVLGTDRLVQILQELRRVEDRVISADVVQKIAERADVDNVLLGSYVKAGGTIRITARLQEARTGRIVTAERVEGPGDTGLFVLVDELTRRFKAKMASLGGASVGSLLLHPGTSPAEEGLDRGVTEITTSSIEAYRYYVEGINFHERGLSEQAAPLLEKAIEIDPNFAMAYAKLAVVNNNIGLFDKRDEYAKRALDLTGRLTSRERYYIEGFYYGMRPETRGRSIEAYQQGLKLHPEHHASRHNLAVHFLNLERFSESIEQNEELIRRGSFNPTTHENLAEAMLYTGNVRRAREVAEEFVRQRPDSATGLRMLGGALTAEGRFDEALAAFEKSEALNPLDFATRLGKRSVAMLQGRWAEAEAINAELARSPNLFQRFLSFSGSGEIAAAHGRGQETLALWDRAANMTGLPPFQRAIARNRQARLLLRRGQPTLALAKAELAIVDARNRDPEFETLQLLAVAQAAVGRKADSEKTLALLESRARIQPTDREVRRLHWVRGQIAFAAGDTRTAVSELTRAQEMLPVHGPTVGPASSHPELWYAAAAASIKAGHDGQAVPLLERLQSSHERVFGMELYARSFFLLAQIYERRGDTPRAREQYARFVELWRNGDLERGWVAEAQKKLAR
jgi:serine/threonine protein kinase/tetratricopeptide (TPR) repeat protein/TolB-like protein